MATRRVRKEVGSPPGDGWIKVVPGERVRWQAGSELSAKVDTLRQWMGAIRSGVLSASFFIENELILLALAAKFGSNDYASVSEEYVEQEQKWREEDALLPKIRRVIPIIRQTVSEDNPDRVISRLCKFRDLQNLMAHYPCWLEPVNVRPFIPENNSLPSDFKLFIANKSYVWEVNHRQAAYWDALIACVQSSLGRVRWNIIGQPPR